MQVDVIALGERGPFEYHVRSFMEVQYNPDTGTLVVPVTPDVSLYFDEVILADIKGSYVELLGRDQESGQLRTIKIST